MKSSDKWQVPPDRLRLIKRHLVRRYRQYNDPWGFDPHACIAAIKLLYPIYKNYFRVHLHGAEKIKEQPYLVTSNHTGQVPIDAILITLAFALETENPRVLRSMVERFLAGLPFLGEITSRLGSILGDRKNCQYLLDQGESILVFPEGVKGIAKNTKDHYKLQNFTHGFYRIALKSKTPILPVAVIGAEEFYPFVHHLMPLAKILGLPALPLTPGMLLGPLGLLPLPSPVDIYIGDPIEIPKDLNPNAPEEKVLPEVFKVEQAIKDLIIKGRKSQRKMSVSNILGAFEK